MSDSEITAIELWLRFEDVCDESCEDEEVDDGYDLSCEVAAVPIGPNRFRLTEPLSITCFGVFVGTAGPMLNLGDVIEVTPLDDGSYGYGRKLESAQIWSRTIGPVSEQRRLESDIEHVLDQFVEAGGAWEWTADCLTLQIELEEGASDPPPWILELAERLLEALRQAGPAQPTLVEEDPIATGRKSVKWSLPPRSQTRTRPR